MKNLKFLLLLAALGVVMTGCSLMGGGDPPEYSLSELQGLWQENSTQHFVRFTTEKSDEASYLYGREWDEAEEIYEQDLIDTREILGHPGNGWFKYLFKTNGDLTEIHLMDNGGAEIPKVYVVSALTDTNLEYYEKDHKSNKYYFTKAVTTK